jgi:23S rRNA pseudouridine1911/1915/1917 synthase
MPDRRVEVDLPDALAGERIDRIVALVGDLSRSEAVRLIDGGSVSVDGTRPAKPSERVAAGATVTIDLPARSDVLVPAPTITVPVVHVDPDVIVVDKPPGLVVHPGAGVVDATMIQGLLAEFPELADAGGDPERPGIVHRLDRGTSGLLMVARHDRARRALAAQLAARTVGRRYLALVWGTVESSEGLIDAPLGRSPNEPTRRAVVAGGRPARTRYQVVDRSTDPDVTLLMCRLETGRTHQIRAHLEAIGHPVVGDVRYAPRRPMLGLRRPFLHAAALEFDHPRTGERLRFESELPDDLARLLDELGLAAPGTGVDHQPS